MAAIEEELPGQKPETLCLLRLLKISGALDKLISKTQCTVNIDDSTVVIRGSTRNEIDDATDILYACLEDMTTRPLHLDDDIVKMFLRTDRGMSWFEDLLRQKRLHAVLYESKDKLMIVKAVDSDTVEDVVRIAERALKREVVNTDSTQTKFLTSGSWPALVRDLEGRLFVKVNFDESRDSRSSFSNDIVVVGNVDDVNIAVEAIGNALNDNGQTSRRIKLEAAQARLLRKHCLDRIVSDLKSNSKNGHDVIVTFDRDSATITGPSDIVDAAEKVISERYVRSIIRQRRTIQQPGLKFSSFDHVTGRNFGIVLQLQKNNACAFGRITPVKRTLSGSGAAVTPVAPAGISNGRNYTSKNSIRVIQGSIADFKADVLVNTLAFKNNNPDWNGAVFKSFSEKAGPSLQQELSSQGAPREFGRDLVKTGVGSLTNAKSIYHVTVTGYRDQKSLELMTACLSRCMEEAKRDRFQSIAFPTLGCGYAKYSPQDVSSCFKEAAHKVDGLQIFILAHDPSLYNEFSRYISSQSNAASAQTQQTVSDSTSASSVKICQGSVTDYKADVLVNTVIGKDKNLKKDGAVSKKFLEIAGASLQQEFSSKVAGASFLFGCDMFKTGSGNIKHARAIYHVPIETFKNQKSVKMLTDSIKLCLHSAKSDGFRTIAFPTLGCGHAKFATQAVADCFKSAAKAVDGLEIVIVAFEPKLFTEFTKFLSNAPAAPSTGAPPGPSVSTQPSAQNRFSRFFSSFLRQSTPSSSSVVAAPAVSQLAAAAVVLNHAPKPSSTDLKQSVEEEEDDTDMTFDSESDCLIFEIFGLDREVIKKVGDELEENIKEMTASERLRIELLKAAEEERKEEFQQKERLEREKEESNPLYIKKHKGVKEYLRVLANEPYRHPYYWTTKGDMNSSQPTTNARNQRKNVTLPASCISLYHKGQVYQAVRKLIIDTWQSGVVGVGNDALNLTAVGHKNIEVKGVWRIENESLSKNYWNKVTTVCKAAVDNLPSPIKNLYGPQAEIKTRELDVRLLEDNLIPEINEYFLFHGTKKSSLAVLLEQGPDPRIAASDYFGSGIYFAESSTKSDQYTDERNSRVRIDEPLYILVCRVALGDVFVSEEPMPLKRPPCKDPKCQAMTCTSHVELYDSVLGYKNSSGQSLLFREFIVYDKNQCYPEFLVEYVRRP